MKPSHPLVGVHVAAVTPLKPDYSPDLDAWPGFLRFLAGRGCHGALLLGTTGEGPSFEPKERIAILRAAVDARPAIPGFRLLAGTGTPSLEETIELTHAAFDLGLDGVVVLPPYYYKRITDDGLLAYYSEVFRRAVPGDGALLGYHIPAVSGVGLSLDLISRLKDAFPNRFAGLKDSTGDPELAQELGARFGEDLVILNGNDSLFSMALLAGAAGCITAAANLFSPDLRRIWEAFLVSETQSQSGIPSKRGAGKPAAALKPADPDPITQARVSGNRATLDHYPPTLATLKALLARCHGFPRWAVRPPLLPTPAEIETRVAGELELD